VVIKLRKLSGEKLNMADDMMGAIKKALLVIGSAITIVGVVFLTLLIYGLLIGAFNQQAQSGNIAVDNTTLTNMNTSVASYWTNVTTVTASIAVVVGFIALVLLFMIFRPFMNMGKKSGSGKVDF